MKHNVKITAILLAMFLITQLIGLFVINFYSQSNLPFGFDTPDPSTNSEFEQVFVSIIFAFFIALFLFFILSKFDLKIILRIWLFVVVAIALGIVINAIILRAGIIDSLKIASIMAIIVSVILSFFKIFKKNFFVHNITELGIYPGIAAVFVPILNVLTLVILLILISIYDMWAVWKSQVMQKMAKYQINKLNFFSGFFVPYLDKKTLKKLKKLKKTKKKLKGKKIKISMAILGGGDVVFPIIAAGVFLRFFGLASALLVIFGALLGLAFLFFFSEKKKFYPAMPFITIGMFLTMIISLVVF